LQVGSILEDFMVILHGIFMIILLKYCVTAKNILIPFCGLNPKCNMQIKKSAPRQIKVVLTTQKEKSALPVKRHLLSALASLYK
jgi:hypothetical protein